MHSPTPAPHRFLHPWFAEGSASIQPLVELSTWMKAFVYLTHLSHTTDIAKAVFPKDEGVVVSEWLRDDHILAHASYEFPYLGDKIPEEAQALTHLPRRQAGLHSPYLLGYVPPHGGELGTSALFAPVGVEARAAGIIYD